MRPAILFLITAACGLAANSHAAEVHYVKPLTLPEFEGEELVAVPLDGDVYEKSHTDYIDLRILDGKQQKQALVIHRDQTKSSRTVQKKWNAERLALQPLEDGGLQITFRSDPQSHNEPPQGIRFFSPVRNFEHHVKVETSADGENWQTILDDGLIFDYSQFMDVRNLTLTLVDALEGHGLFRVTIDDVTQEQQSQLIELSRNLSGDEETGRTERVTINRQPFRIDRIELWHDQVVQDVSVDRQSDYPLTIDSIDQDPETKETHVYLKSHREPLTRVTIVTPDRNFSRRVRLEAQAVEARGIEWEPVAESLLTRIDFRTLKRESLSVRFRENRRVAYRLVIENRDSPPLEITDVKDRGPVYAAVFLADAKAQYSLAYGGRNITRPSYDTATITASLNEGFTPLIATLGAESTVELPPEPTEPPEPFLKRLLNNTLFITSVIGVLVLVLAAGLYRATRHLDDLKES